MKELTELAWNVDESTYRKDSAISYSTLSTFAREGFKGLQRALSGEKLDTPSLRHGSLVDTILTDKENLHNLFLIADYQRPSDIIRQIIDLTWQVTGGKFERLNQVPQQLLLQCIDEVGYGAANWKKETKINKVIDEGGSSYYSILPKCGNRKLIHVSDYESAVACVNTLKTHSFTSWAFDTTDPMIKVYYQLKFKITYGWERDPEGLIVSKPFMRWTEDWQEKQNIRCMFDIIIVNYRDKTIEPIDLKTTGKDEGSFENSIQDWYYDLQATKYSYILRKVCSLDSYFSSFTIKPFSFMCINKYTLTPLVYEYTKSLNNEQKEFRDYLGRKHRPWYDYLKDVRWHINNSQFSYTKEAIENNGRIKVSFYD